MTVYRAIPWRQNLIRKRDTMANRTSRAQSDLRRRLRALRCAVTNVKEWAKDMAENFDALVVEIDTLEQGLDELEAVAGDITPGDDAALAPLVGRVGAANSRLAAVLDTVAPTAPPIPEPVPPVATASAARAARAAVRRQR